MIVTIGEELHGERPVLVDEHLKALMMRADDMRKYVVVLAKETFLPRVCSRCRAEPTDDPKGDSMCPLCVEMAFRRQVPR
jgi:hypothetical protein